MESSSELGNAIRRTFACDADTVNVIATKAATRNYAVRETILRQGERVTHSWLLFEGAAQAVAIGQNGQMVMLGTYSPGDLLGALPGEETSEAESEIVAAKAVKALLFKALDLLALAERHAAVGLTISKALVRRLRTTSRKMVAQVTLSASGRVHAELLRRARDGEDMTIRPAPIMTELAAELMTTRETVSRTVSALERRGIVSRSDGMLRVEAPGRLEEMVI